MSPDADVVCPVDHGLPCLFDRVRRNTHQLLRTNDLPGVLDRQFCLSYMHAVGVGKHRQIGSIFMMNNVWLPRVSSRSRLARPSNSRSASRLSASVDERVPRRKLCPGRAAQIPFRCHSHPVARTIVTRPADQANRKNSDGSFQRCHPLPAGSISTAMAGSTICGILLQTSQCLLHPFETCRGDIGQLLPVRLLRRSQHRTDVASPPLGPPAALRVCPL